MFVEQRTASDCMIACIAMASGVSYERVLEVGLATKAFKEGEGCRNEMAILKALGYRSAANGNFVCRYRGVLAPEFFREFAWGRKAIFTVPSLNIENGWHAVFYDGRRVLDPNPSNRKRYTEFNELRPDELVLFRAGARVRRAA